MRPAIAVLGLTAILVAGCEKTAKTGATTAATQPSAGASQTGYVAGGGAIQNSRQAAKRTEVLNEMNTLGQVIADYDATYGRMPNKQEVEATLQQYPKVAALVKDGSIVLTGSSNRGGCWAYQFEADTKGGIVLVGGRASRMSADEAAQSIKNQ
jgi:hypothetical protein